MTNVRADLAAKLAAEAEHAEKTRDAELSYQRRRPSGAQTVYGLRLPAERIAQLRRLADARGIEPSVLVRHWLIQQLDQAESATHNPATDRWEHDLRATTDHLRELLDKRPA